MRTLALMTLSMMAAPALADDAALLIGNERYETLDRLVGGAGLGTVTTGFAAAGFVVSQNVNATQGETGNALAAFLTETDDAQRMIIALSGRFATDGTRSWFLPVDSEGLGLFGMTGALSVESALQVLAAAQGQAVLVLGVDAAETAQIDGFLREGLGALDVPQGVTVVTGTPGAVADFVVEVAQPGADVVALVEGNRRLAMDGFVPQQLTLVPAGASLVETPVITSNVDPAEETALWEGARALDTSDAYANYLQRYPEGIYAAEAQGLIEEITTEPNRAARLSEEALALSRDARRDIQRDLTLLDFNPRGIDGIFGPGTRNAVKNWQQQNGFSQTTYLTTEQINRLDAQAARRSAELEAAAERARLEQQRLDRAYWEETGSVGDEPGLRAYLERYPDGTFAAQATAQLSEIEAVKQAAAAAEDNAAWETAVATNTVAAYQTYLQAFPSGALIAEAQARIATLTAPAVTDGGAAANVEGALGLNAITMRLIEARLQQLNLEPGSVDGNFDDETRRAIRNFQRDRTLDVSGFLNEETVVRLLADGLQTLGGGN
jgi:peptidoglycan hydrolase-like protein with peptidoglycan-binding domain